MPPNTLLVCTEELASIPRLFPICILLGNCQGMLIGGYKVSKQQECCDMNSNWQLEAQITEGESLGNSLCTIMSGRQRVDAIGMLLDKQS